jgi:hypothetical protein
MIDIILSDSARKQITSCGAGLPEQDEKETYIALRNALLNRSKLIKLFGEKTTEGSE